MTDQCQHGVTARNCHTCFMESEHQKICKRESCWCRLYSANVRGVFMSDLYEAIQPLRERLDCLEKRMEEQALAFSELLASCSLKGPYRCPLCEGYGSVMISKDTAEGPRQHFLKNFACSVCNGKGIVWKS